MQRLAAFDLNAWQPFLVLYLFAYLVHTRRKFAAIHCPTQLQNICCRQTRFGLHRCQLRQIVDIDGSFEKKYPIEKIGCHSSSPSKLYFQMDH